VTAAGLEALRSEAYEALRELFPSAAILQSNELGARRLEGLPLADEIVAGGDVAAAPFLENGFEFVADLEGGQKTGFYCDQRTNRELAGELASGRRVLDLFAHSGAFSVYTGRGGAASVLAVDSSEPALGHLRRHVTSNGVDNLTALRADVFAYLREESRRQEVFDLVICDPPPLARRRGDVERAARAYKDLNRLAFTRLAPGGFLLTFSCSGSVDATLFRQILFAAAAEAGARVSLLRPLSAAADHPVSIQHPEGEYLKGWWCVRE
jgi:23S rRNA (cytosine1962-C5)-methyltransferase